MLPIGIPEGGTAICVTLGTKKVAFGGGSAHSQTNRKPFV